MDDARRHALRRALRVALVAPGVLAASGALLGLPAGMYGSFAAFCLLVFADLGGPLRDRFAANLLVGAAGLVAIVLGTLVAPWAWLAAAVAALVGAGLVLVSVLRGYVAAAVMPVELAYVLTATGGPSLDLLGAHLLSWSIGVVAAALAAVLLWPESGTSLLRLRLAALLTAGADLAAVRWPPPGAAGRPAAAADPPASADPRASADPPAEAADRSATGGAEAALLEAHRGLMTAFRARMTRPGAGTARDRAVLALVEEAGRLRTALRWTPPGTVGLPGDDDLASVVQASLRDDAAALAGDASPITGRSADPPDPRPLLDAREAHVEAAAAWAGPALAAEGPASVRARLDTSFPLRMTAMVASFIAVQTAAAVRAPWPPERVEMFGHPVPTTAWVSTRRQAIRSQLSWDSPWLRNALRTGLGLALAVAVALTLGVEHAFWVVLGTLSVLRLDAVGTGRTALQAVVGTTAGVVAGVVVVQGALHLPDGGSVSLWVAMVITAAVAAYAPGTLPFLWGQAAFSLFVLVMFTVVFGPDGRMAGARFEDVLIGAAVSVVVGLLLWPRGVMVQVRRSLADAMEASAAHLRATGLMIGGRGPQTDVDIARDRAAASIARAAETFDLAFVQGSPDELRVRAWARFVATAGHTTQATDLLAFLDERLVRAGGAADAPGRGDVATWPATPALAAAAEGLADRYAAVAAGLRDLPRRSADAGALPDDDADGASAPADGATAAGELPRTDPRAQDPRVVAARAAATATLAGWAGRTDDRVGRDAVAAAWGVDQLAHVEWLVRSAEGALAALGGRPA